jgi:outer membrane protein OmpA-like peptidoglycan-associated protein
MPDSNATNKNTQWQQFQLGDSITIIIPSDNIFEAGTDRVTDKGKQVLKNVSAVLRKYPQKNILVTANTSDIGTPQFENDLSRKQALNVANYFSDHGVNNFDDYNRKLYYSGLGSTQPIADQNLAKGIAANRRIQITLYNDIPDNDLGKSDDPINSM